MLDDVTMLQEAEHTGALDELRVRTRDDISRLVGSAKLLGRWLLVLAEPEVDQATAVVDQQQPA